MKSIRGLKALIQERNNLPETGWIFVDKGLDKTRADLLLNTNFQIPEDDDDEFFGEDNLATWLEVPTFLAVLRLREKNVTTPSIEEYADAAIHYLVKDDFLE